MVCSHIVNLFVFYYYCQRNRKQFCITSMWHVIFIRNSTNTCITGKFAYLLPVCYILGNYSCLVAQFHMKRSISFHLIQSYLPSILIVAISWVSFWMDLDSVPGRISLGVITMLAVSGQAGVGNYFLSIVRYRISK